HVRVALQVPMLAFAVLMVVHGFMGPQLAPMNLATTAVWVHYRGLVVLSLLAVGNVFCFACPFVLVRDIARRLRVPRLNFPRALRTKWLSLGLFVLVLFLYEWLDLWA